MPIKVHLRGPNLHLSLCSHLLAPQIDVSPSELPMLSKLPSIDLSDTFLVNLIRFVRYGGKATASPCPQLAVDAALDYGVDSSLWLGSAGVISSAHFDLFDNLFCLVRGCSPNWRHSFIAGNTLLNLYAHVIKLSVQNIIIDSDLLSHAIQVVGSKTLVVAPSSPENLHVRLFSVPFFLNIHVPKNI